MKKNVFLIIMAIVISSCTNKVATSEIENRSGGKLFYKGEPYSGKVFELFDNGLQKLNFEAKDGEKNGLYEEYFENTKLKSKINYKNGNLEGLFEEYIENGVLKEKGIYKNNKLTGNYFLRTEGISNIYYEEYNIKDNGVVEKYETHLNSKTGQLIKKFILLNNKIGTYELYYDNGQLLTKHNIRAFKFGDQFYPDYKVGLIIHYYENGEIADKGNYALDGYIGQKTGRWEHFYENGQVKEIIDYDEKGIPHGTTFSYYENGEISKKVIY